MFKKGNEFMLRKKNLISFIIRQFVNRENVTEYLRFAIFFLETILPTFTERVVRNEVNFFSQRENFNVVVLSRLLIASTCQVWTHRHLGTEFLNYLQKNSF